MKVVDLSAQTVFTSDVNIQYNNELGLLSQIFVVVPTELSFVWCWGYSKTDVYTCFWE